jgi:hypothetical protein
LVAVSAAGVARLLAVPVTRTTGVWPQQPQLRPLGGLKPWPGSSSNRGRRPGPPSFVTGQVTSFHLAIADSFRSVILEQRRCLVSHRLAGPSLVRVLTMLTQPREAPIRVTNMRNNN